jgi:hypothetical protein
VTSELPALWMEESPLELPGGAPSTLKPTAKTVASGSAKAAASAKPRPKSTAPSTAEKPHPSSTTAAPTATAKAKAKANAAPATLPALTQASLAHAAQSSQPPLPSPRSPGSEVDSEVGSLPEVAVSLHHQPRPTTKPLGLHRSATRAEDILKPPPFQQYYGSASTLRPKAFFQAAEAHTVRFLGHPSQDAAALVHGQCVAGSLTACEMPSDCAGPDDSPLTSVGVSMRSQGEMSVHDEAEFGCGRM